MRNEDKDIALFTAYEDAEPFDPAGPEKNLLLAVLTSALSDLKQDGQPARRATEFFLSSDEDYIFSFRGICSYLDIDPGKVLMIAGLPKSQNGSNGSNGKA